MYVRPIKIKLKEKFLDFQQFRPKLLKKFLKRELIFKSVLYVHDDAFLQLLISLFKSTKTDFG